MLRSLPPIGDELSETEEIEEASRRDQEIETRQVESLSEAEFRRRVEAARKH